MCTTRASANITHKVQQYIQYINKKRDIQILYKYSINNRFTASDKGGAVERDVGHASTEKFEKLKKMLEIKMTKTVCTPYPEL